MVQKKEGLIIAQLMSETIVILIIIIGLIQDVWTYVHVGWILKPRDLHHLKYLLFHVQIIS